MDPRAVVVMGVSGSGKSTVGRLLAQRLGWPYADGDEFHPAANIARMAAGQPLTDADRRPWLAAIEEWIDGCGVAGKAAVVSCSALRRAFRERLRRDRPWVRCVFLDAPPTVLAQRMSERGGHFMKADMLASQLAALERPTPDEGVLTVDATAPPAVILDEILTWLGVPASPPAEPAPPVEPHGRPGPG